MYNLFVMKNLIFDLDGTLWDATEQNRKSFEDVGKEFFGKEYRLTLEQLQHEMGKTMDVIAKDISPKDIDDVTRDKFAFTCFAREVFNLSTNPGILYPNELEVLEELKENGYKLFIVSNCQKGYIEQYLKLVPSDLFSAYMCFGDTNLSKDKTIRELMRKERIEEAVYIGDTSGDETSAHLASLPFVFASYGFGTSLNHEGIISSLTELKEVVDKLYLEKFGK